MRIIEPHHAGVDILKEHGANTLTLCYQCGLCSGVCPWHFVREFPVQRLIREAHYGFFDTEKWWNCTTCASCVTFCPRKVNIIDIIRAGRRIMVAAGVTPDGLKNVMNSLQEEGNPWREARGKRADWAGVQVPQFRSGAEWLYFTCCTVAYDPAEKRVAQSSIYVLRAIGINFGYLGVRENCCGESVRKVGNEKLFESLAYANIKTFQEHGVRKIIVDSPHCYTTFRVDYPELGGRFEVVHIVQIMVSALKAGILKFVKPVKKRVIYHDPCYLGRHNGIYEEPRILLRGIPELELIEFPRSRQHSICCGGGGGGLWRGAPRGENLAELRVTQALECGAEVICVACPYCLINFEDAIKVMGKQDKIEVKSISHLVQEAMG